MDLAAILHISLTDLKFNRKMHETQKQTVSECCEIFGDWMMKLAIHHIIYV